GGLAHDFNNPLHALRGFADFVERDPGLRAVSRDDLHQVVRAADRMASLTRQLLAFSRRQVLAPETVDLDTTIAEMQPMLQRLIGSDIEMRIERAVGTKWIRFDPAQLLQVVMNLAINARDAMPGGGRLLMRTATRHLARGEMTMADGTPVEGAEYAELTVSDSGSGIPPEHLSQIFEPFFTTKRVGEGTGLGLPTVQGIVTQSRGVIQVESEPGNGTTFTVLLPVSDPPVRTQPMRGARIGGEDRSARVLVVDDEELVREVVARSLEAAGFRVHRARHGAEALEVIAQVTEPIDIIVSDVVMPVMGGRELGRRLAELRPDLPVIWMSGHPREALTDLTSDSPDRPYLQKPVTPDYLVASVQRVLQARESVHEDIRG